MKRYDVIVIGAGSAGLNVAVGAKNFGLKVLLVEKHKIGGDCLNYGCVPSKTFIMTAKVLHKIDNAKDYGVKGATADFDFKYCVNHFLKQQNIIKEHENPDYLKKEGLDVVLGNPEFVNSNTIKINDKEYTAKKFAVCTGGSPFIPPIEGLKEAGYITNEEIFYLKEMPKSMVIIGGGPIGCEMAQTFQRFGCDVALVQRSERIMPREDAELTSILENVFKKEGMKVFTSADTIKVEKRKEKRKGEKKVVTVKYKGKNMNLVADEILVATGRRPNVDGLNLEKAGIAYDKKGIKTNKRMQTSNRHIFAAGDVVGPYQFTHTAETMASVIIQNMIFKIPKKINWNVVPWVTFTDPELAKFGVSPEEAKDAGADVIEFDMKELDRAICEAEMVGKAKFVVKNGRIIGANILGTNAGEYFHQLILATQEKINVKKLAQMIYVYPTWARVSKRTIGNYYKPKLFNEKMQKIARFLFNLW